MLTLSAIRPAVRRALAAAALAAIVMPVHAQERPQTTEYPEEVIVTGSRIRRVDTETPSPVQMVDRADIERTGRQNISEVLRGLISADNQGSIPTAFSGGFASGSSAVSLRGLGVNSTLVLLNGRRMATYGLADDGSRTFVDLNVIPLEAVERVEVLKDGGSALYGSDAVAGVVNIITRERYEGITVGGSYGATEFNDGDAHRIHGSAGFSGDNYNVFVVAEQSSDDAISQANRPGYLGTSNLTQFGFFDNRRGAVQAGLGVFLDGQPAYSATTPFGVLRTPGSTDFYDRVDVLPCNEISGATGRCLFDLVGFTEIQPKQERMNVLSRGTLDITPALQAYTELGFFASKVEAVGTPGSVNDNGVFDPANPAAPVTHSSVLPANHPDNPFGVARSRFGLLTTMLGGRNGKQESELVRVVAGLKGDITADWNWEAGVAYIENTLEDTNYGFIHFPTLQSALDTGRFRFDPALNSPELLRAISPELKRTAESSVELVDASVSGLLINLPGGRLGIAAGAEFRTEKNDTPPVPFTDRAEIVGLGFSAFTAERDVYAAYVEVDAPVHSMVDLNAAVRYDHYSDFGSSTTPKLGVKFKPFQQLALRATYAEAFRAPGPAESGNSSTFGFTNIGILTTGNPDLEPEEAKSYTLGVVYEPLRNTSISLDYYQIKRENEIVQADQGPVIGNLPTVGQPPNSQRPGALPNSTLFFDENGDLATIAAPYINANSTDTDGIDLDVRQKFDLGGMGNLTAGLIWTRLFSFERELPNGQKFEYVGTHGPFVLSSAGGTPRDRGRFELTWDAGVASVTAAVNFVSSLNMIDHKGETLVDNEDGTFATTTHEGDYVVADPTGRVCGVYNPDGTVRNGCRVDAFTTLDLFGRFKGGENWEINASIINALGKQAPFDPYTYGGLNYNPAFHQAGAVGRFFTLGLRYSFQ
ncbi:MAG: TonB-dependent receptor plug domain-containing protein [Steroidobacteraceae bacterium]